MSKVLVCLTNAVRCFAAVLLILSVSKADAQTCINSNQCATGLCLNGQCAPTKSDGQSCGSYLECSSKNCSNRVCSGTGGNSTTCSTGNQCASGTCSSGRCSIAKPDGSSCNVFQECQSKNCTNGICLAGKAVGGACTTSNECASKNCVQSYCAARSGPASAGSCDPADPFSDCASGSSSSAGPAPRPKRCVDDNPFVDCPPKRRLRTGSPAVTGVRNYPPGSPYTDNSFIHKQLGDAKLSCRQTLDALTAYAIDETTRGVRTGIDWAQLYLTAVLNTNNCAIDYISLRMDGPRQSPSEAAVYDNFSLAFLKWIKLGNPADAPSTADQVRETKKMARFLLQDGHDEQYLLQAAAYACSRPAAQEVMTMLVREYTAEPNVEINLTLCAKDFVAKLKR